MNKPLRLLWLLLIARFRRRCDLLGPCRTPFRVMPTDLDTLGHVNNGVYLSIMDLARVDLMIRAGVFAKAKSRGWYPVVTAETIRFRRSLTLFQPFAIETAVIGWDDQAVFLRQQFIRHNNVIASAVVQACFLKKTGGRVSSEELLALAGHSGERPPLPDWVRRWSEDQASWLPYCR